MSAISTTMINKRTSLRLRLACRNAKSGITNASLINHGWLANLLITNTLRAQIPTCVGHLQPPPPTPSPPQISAAWNRIWDNEEINYVKIKIALGRWEKAACSSKYVGFMTKIVMGKYLLGLGDYLFLQETKHYRLFVRFGQMNTIIAFLMHSRNAAHFSHR